MAKRRDSSSEMAHARQSDGINVIFDQNSPSSSPSSRSSASSGTGRDRGRTSHRRRHRSSSSSSSPSSRSRSSSRPRSRSHPRCHRRSSRCRCSSHYRYGRDHYRRSHRSRSRSPSSDRYTRYRSRSRSSSNRNRRTESQMRSRSSRHTTKTHRSRSRSRSSGRSVRLSSNDKKDVIIAAKINTVKSHEEEDQEPPKSLSPAFSEQSMESNLSSPEPETWVRQDPVKTPSESDDMEPDDVPSPPMSPKRKIISFSINNAVVKPATTLNSSAKVTPRVDLYESRKPYGHWVTVKSSKSSKARKHTLAKSH